MSERECGGEGDINRGRKKKEKQGETDKVRESKKK